MSGSMLIIPLMPDTEGATKALQDWAKEMEGKIKVAPSVGAGGSGGAGGGGSNSRLGGAAEDLDRIKAKAKNADDALSKLAEAEQYEKLASWMSDVRDAFDVAAQTMMGFSDVEAQAASQSAYLAEKGITVGAAFGVVGAVLGGVVGTGLAVLNYRATLAQEALRKLMTESQRLAEGQLQAARETRQLISSLEDLDKFSLSGASSSIEMINSAATELLEDMELIKKKQLDYQAAVAAGMTPTEEEKAAYRELGVQSDLLLGKFLRLRDEREKSLPEIRTGITGELSSAWLEVGDALDRSKTSMSDLKGTAKTAKDNLKAARTELTDLRKEAETETDPVALEEIAKRAKVVFAAIAEATKAFDASSDEIERRNKEAAEKAGQALVKALQKQNKEAEKERQRYAEPRAADMIKEYDEFTKQQDAIAEFEANAYVKRDEDRAAFASSVEQHEWRVFWTKQEIAEKEKELREKERQETAQHYEEVFAYATDFLGGFTEQLEANLSAGRGAFERMGLAAQKGVATVLKALGKKWALTATAELAEAFSWLGVPGGQENAAEHFASAALYGSAAAAAGVAGAVVGGRAAAKEDRLNEQERGASGGGFGGAGTAGRVTDSGPTEQAPVVIYYGDNNIFTGEGAEGETRAGHRILGLIDRAKRGGPTLRGRR